MIKLIKCYAVKSSCSTTVGVRSGIRYTESWLVCPPLLGDCMMLRSGKTTGMASDLSWLMEFWLKESRQRKAERRKEDERRNKERQKEEVHREEERRRYEEGWRRKEEEWRRLEEERAQRTEEIMRTLVNTLTEREP